ncbi:MAG: hypothetical protein SGPRY_008738, partial [Prymnesium sp.]
LLPEKKLLIVNAMLRIDFTPFESSHMGRRGERGTLVQMRNRGGLEIVSEDLHNEIRDAL